MHVRPDRYADLAAGEFLERLGARWALRDDADRCDGGQDRRNREFRVAHRADHRRELGHDREVELSADERLESVSPVGGKLVANYTHNASSELLVFPKDGGKGEPVALPSIGSTGGFNGLWNSKVGFYTFDTYDVPATVYEYDFATGKSSVWAANKVPIDPNQFQIQQVWYESKDKTRIPMFLFSKKGMKLDGSNPVLLTAYGGFNVSETPAYSSFFVTWVEMGGIVAEPNIRGGGEFGEDWHRAGMMEKKQNVFDDFQAAAEFLISSKYTEKAKLAIMGGSNGGLLMGASVTQRPDLFQAVVCTYPLLDMLRYQKFEDGPYWVSEYGSADKPDQFQYIVKYSPYQNVKKGTKYPAVLFVTGDGDTRVDPLHARKMTAEMQADNASDNPILLLYDTKSGHSGGRPIKKIIEENTDILSFLTWQLGMNAAH